eukprot:TRINITY_DN74286_c0_g1_i1.p1 TRINITY_DN74286_c0_g1~~TRINITY_DN74286_c0_g1_i1.p1  ORF type:complete len:425 (-),score=43.63 TRINITY_DN74286_c0_g1_i1:127-1356(-)
MAGSQAPPPPRSCDTLVILPEPSSGLPVCFGKNSDRPSDEEHEVVYIPRRRYDAGSRVRCTYIEIPQVSETFAVVLSKPRWLWGCEMGANDRGVVGGNEAVWTRAHRELGSQERLLGMDILRLALERASTAQEAVEICAKLLEDHGQGGGCAEDDSSWTYENGFLFADGSQAFVLETAGVSWWAVERVPAGSVRNISNGISIRSEVHMMHPGLKDHCKAKGWWDGECPFDFKAILTGQSSTRALAPEGRELAGQQMLSAIQTDVVAGQVATGQVLAKRMMNILRDEDSGICFRDLHGFNSTGSQVSLLYPSMASAPRHFFTCASDPKLAVYKMFMFPESSNMESGDPDADAKCQQLSLEVWRRHRAIILQGSQLPDLSSIEAVALQNDCSDSLTTLLEKELAILPELAA